MRSKSNIINILFIISIITALLLSGYYLFFYKQENTNNIKKSFIQREQSQYLALKKKLIKLQKNYNSNKKKLKEYKERINEEINIDRLISLLEKNNCHVKSLKYEKSHKIKSYTIESYKILTTAEYGSLINFLKSIPTGYEIERMALQDTILENSGENKCNILNVTIEFNKIIKSD